MTKTSVLVVGLDGATWKTLKPAVTNGTMPYLKKLIAKANHGVSLGTIPPLTPSVWTSFLTGVNPGKHGIFGFLNYRKNKKLFGQGDIKFTSLTKELKSYGKKTYLSFGDLDGLIEEAGVENAQMDLDEIVASANKKVEEYIGKNRKLKPDFSFVLLKEVDKAQHLFWGTKKLNQFYKSLDNTLERLVTYYLTSTPGRKYVIFVSDHGFHNAATTQFSVYPWLVKNGYLDRPKNYLWLAVHNANALLKKSGLNLTQLKTILNLRNRFVSKLEKQSEQRKENNLLVTFEGLYVKRGTEIAKIISDLRKVTYQGKKVFQQVFANTDVYKGPYYDLGPDVVWLPNENFHINISPLEKNIFSARPTDIPGDHVADRQGIFVISSSSQMIKSLPKSLSITDLTALIYDLLKVKKPFGLDGVSPIADYSLLDKKISQAQKVIWQAYKKYGKNMQIAFTGRKDSTVMMDIARKLFKNKKVNLPKAFFIDHGGHFAESIKFLSTISKKWGIELSVIKKPKGNLSYAQVKIEALKTHIETNKLKAVMSAIRKDENLARRNEMYFSKRDNHMRVHPMLNFNEQDIWDYIKRFKLSYNPLYDQGYRSLEEKITKKVFDYKQDERVGRAKNKEQIMDKLRKLGYF